MCVKCQAVDVCDRRMVLHPSLLCCPSSTGYHYSSTHNNLSAVCGEQQWLGRGKLVGDLGLRSSVPSVNRVSERAEETSASTPENKPQLDSMSRELLEICSNNWSEERTSLPERTWATVVGILIDNRIYWCFFSTSDHVYRVSIQPNQPHQRNTSATKALRHGYSQSQTWQTFIIEGMHAAKNNLELQDFHYLELCEQNLFWLCPYYLFNNINPGYKVTYRMRERWKEALFIVTPQALSDPIGSLIGLVGATTVTACVLTKWPTQASFLWPLDTSHWGVPQGSCTWKCCPLETNRAVK